MIPVALRPHLVINGIVYEVVWDGKNRGDESYLLTPLSFVTRQVDRPALDLFAPAETRGRRQGGDDAEEDTEKEEDESNG